MILQNLWYKRICTEGAPGSLLQWYTRYGSVVVDIVDTGIPCCRCIAEVSGRVEGADYEGAIHRGREGALGVESGALPGCQQLLRPYNVPACPSRDADDSQGRSFPPPLLCLVSILLFYPFVLFLPFPSLLLFLFSFSFRFLSFTTRATRYRSTSFFSPCWFRFRGWNGRTRHGKAEEVNLASWFCPTSYTFLAPFSSKRARRTLTPPTPAIEREPGEIFERYTARRG